MTPFMFKPLIFKPLTLIKDHPPLAYALSGMVAVGIIWLSLTPLDELPPVPGGDKTLNLIAYSACLSRSLGQATFDPAARDALYRFGRRHRMDTASCQPLWRDAGFPCQYRWRGHRLMGRVGVQSLD